MRAFKHLYCFCKLLLVGHVFCFSNLCLGFSTQRIVKRTGQIFLMKADCSAAYFLISTIHVLEPPGDYWPSDRDNGGGLKEDDAVTSESTATYTLMDSAMLPMTIKTGLFLYVLFEV